MRKYLIVLCIFLTACGFHLRGQYSLPPHLQTLAIQPDDPYSPLQREIRSSLRLSGVSVSEDTKQNYTLKILSHNLSRSVLIIGTDGQAKQEQLIYTVKYQVIPPNQDAMPEQTIVVERMLKEKFNQTMGQSKQEEILLAEMRRDVASQQMRRLNVLKP